VDLAADFRLHDPALYPTWYGAPHTAPELLGQFVYGLPELHREELRGARLIAAPGCYPTAAILALSPLLRAGVVVAHPAAGPTNSSTSGSTSSSATGFDLMTGSEPGGSGFPEPSLIVDAASGVSGAGRSPRDELHFSAVDEDFIAYGLLDHRHTAEMEQSLGTQVLFTPHLAPMVRGILATCYGRPTAPDGGNGALTTESVMEILHRQYDDEPFVVVTDHPPSTKATSGSNCAHVTARVDRRTGWVLAFAAIDNLIKGASGQAVQCANLAVGLPEGAGLPMAGVYP
jgi:N-acetyl-gamma-glutamyl-phosphate reductase